MKLELFSRGAAVRLAVLFTGLGVASWWVWCEMIRMPLASYAGPLPPSSPREVTRASELRTIVQDLAESSARSVMTPKGLGKAADRIARTFADGGGRVSRQTYLVEGVPCDNVEDELRGREQPDDIVLVGAHYDAVAFTHGADDNASGVAALLVLQRSFADRRLAKTLRFVAFANEEPPYFQTAQMGSVVYARRSRERGERVVAMLSLETLGYYSDAPGSQAYPALLGLVYPSRGDFIAFVGDRASRDLVRRVVGTFRAQTAFPSEGAALPPSLPGVGWSDQWSFWQQGYPGVMVTDTAPFRYAQYHTENDTPDKLDYDRMARVVGGLEHVLEDLAGAAP